ncbi:MAG: ABC transporter substrate-binding protein [Armatimonadetes bacterium]|nr:ABC transporter substrate-binding protein [Armatimonadota bacterium]
MKTLGKLVPLLAVVLVIGAFWASEVIVRPKEIKDRVRISYWEKWSDIEFEAIKRVVDEFNDSQDDIYVDLLPVSSIHQKTMLATSAGVPPDVAGLYSFNVAQYVHDNAIIPLDEFCKDAGITRDDYIAVYWDLGVFQGKIYALPTTPATNALHYNKAMFRNAGLDADSPPKTIEELDEYSKALTKIGKNGSIVQSGFMHAEPGWWNWAWGYFFGGRLWDGESQITCNEPEIVEAMRWVQKHAQQFGTGNLQNFKSGFGKFASPQNAFMDEKVAMVLQGVWMSNFINTYNPDLEWDAVPFPHPASRPDLANMTIAEADILVIPRGAKHPKEAFEFIKFVQSQHAMELLCLGQRKHSPLAEASDEFYEQHPNPRIRLFTELAKGPNAVSVPKIAIWPEYQAELQNAFDEVYINGMDPQEAMDMVKRRVQPMLDKYLRESKIRQEAQR